jgi:hypothetical protein
MTNEEDLQDTAFPPQRMVEILEQSATLEGAAARVWQLKAAGYADLVNVQEGGSRRDLGGLYKNALAMAAHYAELTVVEIDELRRTTTRAIVRP